MKNSQLVRLMLEQLMSNIKEYVHIRDEIAVTLSEVDRTHTRLASLASLLRFEGREVQCP